MKKTHRFPIIRMMLGVWASVSLACVSVTPLSVTPQSEPPKSGTENAPSPAPGIPSSRLGDVVEQSGYTLSASKVEYPTDSGYSFETPDPAYKLVAVEITLGNVSGAEALNVTPYYAYLVDSDGFVYETHNSSRDDELNRVELNIGEKAKGWVTFRIPASATPAYIKYKTNYSSDYESFLIAGLAE